MNINVIYILSIIHLDDRNINHINIINKLKFNQFHDRCPFVLGIIENSAVFNGIIIIYGNANIIYAINK